MVHDTDTDRIRQMMRTFKERSHARVKRELPRTRATRRCWGAKGYYNARRKLIKTVPRRS